MGRDSGDMTASRTIHLRASGAAIAPMFALALAAVALTGCATTETDIANRDDSAARFLVAPGKYRLYNCPQIKEAAAANVKRQHELEELMVKAGAGAGGDFVNTVAYRPEYLSLRGQMMDLRRTAADKNCDFVPGEAPGARTASGRAMR